VYELLLLTKSGREISVAQANTQDEAKQLSEQATHLLGNLKTATERNDVVIVQSGAHVYWILPTEVEGMSLFHVDDSSS
jgi:hypothetical protein